MGERQKEGSVIDRNREEEGGSKSKRKKVKERWGRERWGETG